MNWNYSPAYYDRSLTTLETALEQIPAYRSWRAFDPGPDRAIDVRYAAMPALTKKDIREHLPQGFVPNGRDMKKGLDSGEISLVNTSGSIDVSVTNIWNQKWWDASERASWKLNSHANRLATGNHPEAILANPLNVGFVSNEVDLPMEKRRLSRFLYLNEKSNPVTWSSALMDRMIAEVAIFQPAVLEANPSLLARLCRYAYANKKTVFQPGLIIFTYEFPTNLHYKQIRRVFTSPMASSYGTTETGYVFMQCEAGKFHQNTEYCHVDFQPLKKEHGGPLIGRILVTTFNNPWYYMVRFDVGDLVRIDSDGKCECGRDSGMILSAVEGRSANVTFTTKGRLVTPRELDNTLIKLEDIDEFRLDQVQSDVYELHLVSQRTDKNNLTKEATTLLKKLYGRDARISIVYETAISPEPSGKYCVSKPPFTVDIEKYLDKTTLNQGKYDIS
jgi:phenylacetate-coenzyme A ligase PaaK-like adenylate-forming protein